MGMSMMVMTVVCTTRRGGGGGECVDSAEMRRPCWFAVARAGGIARQGCVMMTIGRASRQTRADGRRRRKFRMK